MQVNNRISVDDYILSNDTNINDFHTFANSILVEICVFADNNNVEVVSE